MLTARLLSGKLVAQVACAPAAEGPLRALRSEVARCLRVPRYKVRRCGGHGRYGGCAGHGAVKLRAPWMSSRVWRMLLVKLR